MSLSMSYLPHSSARWGLSVCFSMTNCAPTATLGAHGSVSLWCQPGELRSIHCSFRGSHPFAADVKPWLWHAAGPSLLSPSPVTALDRCPLLCLLYYPGCTVICLSLAFPTYLPTVICSFQSLFLCSEGVRHKCSTFCCSKVFFAGILRASALCAFQKCFFNNAHKY